MYVSDTRYGHAKAKRHAQSEANRIGKRVYLQLDSSWAGTRDSIYVSVTRNHLMLPGAPFYTYYPETTTPTAKDETR